MQKVMKRVIFVCLWVSCVLTACSPYVMQGSPAAVQTGSAIGGVLGAIVGDRVGGYNGSQFGALIGTVAGAAVGDAVTTPRKETGADEGYYEEMTPPVSGLEITNLRFVDDNRNHVIDALEESKLVFDIVNNGVTPAYNVTPIVEEVSGIKHLGISSPAQISYMPVADRIRYTASIRGEKKLKTGEAHFRVYAVESNGAVTEVHEFSLPTSKRQE